MIFYNMLIWLIFNHLALIVFTFMQIFWYFIDFLYTIDTLFFLLTHQTAIKHLKTNHWVVLFHHKIFLILSHLVFNLFCWFFYIILKFSSLKSMLLAFFNFFLLINNFLFIFFDIAFLMMLAKWKFWQFFSRLFFILLRLLIHIFKLCSFIFIHKHT